MSSRVAATGGGASQSSRVRGTVRGLAVACHTGPTVMVTLLAAAFALGVGASGPTTALVAAAVLAGQLSVGWSNDWLDAARDLAVGRTGKPVVDGLVTAAQLRAAALVALGACVVLSVATGWLPGAVHLVAVASAWAYNLRLKSTVWSPLPYAVSFGLLLLFVVLAVTGTAAAPWAIAATALLGVGAHVANTLPDLEDDAATGVTGLPHRLGRRLASVVAPLVLVGATAVALLGPATPPGPVRWAAAGVAAALAVVAGVIGWTRPASRAPFTLSMAVAAVCVVLLVTAGSDVAL
ncbi:UbiA family prenyltransferase [Oerskovia flava]|uniref:UbiA family prenyltransferase n=1 Tax=Oerskovia flava TaxID=2986422 RepID=UPI00223ECDB0|nr:UbiA family prenyltransferase [Oerskovia sp. JB1-3-2]